jgi:hypothetical protein
MRFYTVLYELFLLNVDKRVPFQTEFKENNIYFLQYPVQDFNVVAIYEFSICYAIIL